MTLCREEDAKSDPLGNKGHMKTSGDGAMAIGGKHYSGCVKQRSSMRGRWAIGVRVYVVEGPYVGPTTLSNTSEALAHPFTTCVWALSSQVLQVSAD